MASVTHPLAPTAIRRLHRAAIDRPQRIRALFEQVQSEGVQLRSGMDRRNNSRTATVRSVEEASMVLESQHAELERHAQIYFSFELRNNAYFFAASPTKRNGGARFEVRLPRAIYETERRDVPRDLDAPSWQVKVMGPNATECVADVVDDSYSGLGVVVPGDFDARPKTRLRVQYLGGQRIGEHAYAEVRHVRSAPGRGGALRLGLAVTQVPPGAPIEIQRRDQILEGNGVQRAWRQIALTGAAARTAPRILGRRLGFRSGRRPKIEIVRFSNERGEPLTGLLDRTGRARGGPAVVIPPAWGRTKETLLPLALTLARTFEAAGEPLTVLRFDGTQRRGESWVEPENRQPGNESLGFTFSQAARDVAAAVRFVHESPEIEASKVVLVTFSLAAIDGRRAVASDPDGAICGWVSVVGMVDVQSGLRSVSGGVDYVYGAQRGVDFGVHELGGVTVDIDRAARDVIESRLGGFEDARRDMHAIDVPVTWIHGRDDGWMDVGQVRDLVSAGNGAPRKLIEVPTGHQLRTSRAAAETFQLVAQEVSELATGRRLPPKVPDLVELGARQEGERSRRPQQAVDLRRFWHDYLVGRDGTLGIELLSATSGYRAFMEAQIAALRLTPGSRVLDLGCGTGDFLVHLPEDVRAGPGLHVTAVDFVAAGLRRARARAAAAGGVSVEFVLSDLDCGERQRVPFGDARFDALLASLLISYLKEPEALLSEARRLLRPGGRLVLSAPRRDADLSKLYTDMMAELTPDRVREHFGGVAAMHFDEIQRRYLNEAARLVTLEEVGEFRFRDAGELAKLAKAAGFRDVTTDLALGTPPQAVILTARRP